MENISTLWLNFVFLLMVQLHECQSSSITNTMLSTPSMPTKYASNATTRMTATRITISSTVGGINSTSTSLSVHNSNRFSSQILSMNVSSSRATTNTITAIVSKSRTTSPPLFSSGKASSSAIGSSSVVSGNPGDTEPKTKLYVWQLVAIGCGAFVLVLFIIIGLLCYQNRLLKKKLNASRSYTLPIKENGAWIDNQDIPLWQKRASAFVNETPSEENPPTLTT